jgi:hypothetical protein
MIPYLAPENHPATTVKVKRKPFPCHGENAHFSVLKTPAPLRSNHTLQQKAGRASLVQESLN